MHSAVASITLVQRHVAYYSMYFQEALPLKRNPAVDTRAEIRLLQI